MNRLAILLAGLASWAAHAQAPVSLAPLLDRYLGADTYCENGKLGMRDAPAQGYTEVPFARCVHSDGRFKLVEYPGTRHQIVTWTDGAKFYRYAEPVGVYQEYPLDRPYFTFSYGNRGERYPAFMSSSFPWRTASRSGGADAATGLEGFRASSALSTPRHTVYERHGGESVGAGERIWVLTEDRLIVRWESLQGGEVHRFVEITSQRINPRLDDGDLSHDVPLYARYSLQNNPLVFITGLFVAAALGGALFWAWLFARAAGVEDVARKRRKLWRFQLWTLGVAGAVLAVLAVLSIGSKGHPPAIVFVLVLAVWCAGLFGLMALFTLMSYPVQLFFQRREAPGAG